jgi:methyl-accepting chemotaxis protein
MGRFIKTLSFRAKLIGLCLFLSLISITIGGLSFKGLHEVETSYDQVTEGVMPNLNLLNNMFLSYRAIRINLRTLGLPGITPQDAEEAAKHAVEAIESFEKYDQVYQKIPFVDGEKELYDAMDKEWHNFKEIGQRALALHKSGKPEDREKLLKIFFDDCPKAAKEFTIKMNAIKDFHENNAKTFSADAQRAARNANQYILLVAILGIFLGLSMGVYFATTLSRSIKNVTSILSENAEQVTAASVQIAASSGQLSQATTEQAASLQQTSAALEEISTMITKASENANITSSSSNESQVKAEEGRQSVDLMLSSIDEISQSNDAIMNQINDSNQKMTEIVNVIQEIGNKTKVINEIVFQTKLLSFNASVEAARAGEHGKGFAVVAEEVGNLAQMSGNAAKEISDMLNTSIPKVEAIVEETKSKVELLISEAKIKVNSGVDVAKQCSGSLNEIVSNINRVADLAQEISSAGREQSLGVSEINKAMSQLDLVTQQNSSTSEETAAAAKELASQATSLNEAIKELSNIVNGSGDTPQVEVQKEVTRKSAPQERAQLKPVAKKSTSFNNDPNPPDRLSKGFEDAA